MSFTTVAKSFFVMKIVRCRAFCLFMICAAKFTRAELGEKQRSPVVQTVSGAVVGKIETLPYGKSVYEYLGIPYAEPPVGDLRFAAPKPAKPWSGTKEAIQFGAECAQPQFIVPGMNITESGNHFYFFFDIVAQERVI